MRLREKRVSSLFLGDMFCKRLSELPIDTKGAKESWTEKMSEGRMRRCELQIDAKGEGCMLMGKMMAAGFVGTRAAGSGMKRRDQIPNHEPN